MNVFLPTHVGSLLLLFNLKLRKKIDKPFKAGVVSVDPKEIDLLEIEKAVNSIFSPMVLTLRT